MNSHAHGPRRSPVAIPHPPVHGIHEWLPGAARALHTNGYTADEAVAKLLAFESSNRRPYQRAEVERAVQLIYDNHSVFPIESKQKPQQAKRDTSRPRGDYKPGVLAKLAAHLPAANEDWFKARSPIPVEDMRPESYLWHITNEGDRILCFTNLRSQGEYLWINKKELVLPDETFAPWSHSLKEGAWFLPQPVTGEFVGDSRRSAKNVTHFRFALIESDIAPCDQWLSALAQLPLPIVSVVSSGGKSIHALVLVNAESKSQWDELMRKKLSPLLTVLGADRAALTAVRQTRLPSVHRGERLQELSYLNPAASCIPIAKLEPRPPHASVTQSF